METKRICRTGSGIPTQLNLEQFQSNLIQFNLEQA